MYVFAVHMLARWMRVAARKEACMHARAEQSSVGFDELRGLQALEHAMKTGTPLHRRTRLGMKSETISTRAGYCLWGLGYEQQLYVQLKGDS